MVNNTLSMSLLNNIARTGFSVKPLQNLGDGTWEGVS